MLYVLYACVRVYIYVCMCYLYVCAMCICWLHVCIWHTDWIWLLVYNSLSSDPVFIPSKLCDHSHITCLLPSVMLCLPHPWCEPGTCWSTPRVTSSRPEPWPPGATSSASTVLCCDHLAVFWLWVLTHRQTREYSWGTGPKASVRSQWVQMYVVVVCCFCVFSLHSHEDSYTLQGWRATFKKPYLFWVLVLYRAVVGTQGQPQVAG